MSLFRVLSAVCKVLKKLKRDILWKEVDKRKGSCLVRWEVRSKPLNLGGSSMSNVRAIKHWLYVMAVMNLTPYGTRSCKKAWS